MRRILIIDDEDDIREVAALSLEAIAGWEILTASSQPVSGSLAATSGTAAAAILRDAALRAAPQDEG